MPHSTYPSPACSRILPNRMQTTESSVSAVHWSIPDISEGTARLLLPPAAWTWMYRFLQYRHLCSLLRLWRKPAEQDMMSVPGATISGFFNSRRWASAGIGFTGILPAMGGIPCHDSLLSPPSCWLPKEKLLPAAGHLLPAATTTKTPASHTFSRQDTRYCIILTLTVSPCSL